MNAHPFRTALLLAALAFAGHVHSAPAVTDVWIVSKTHFDLGFTDLAENVFQRYRGEMLDKALAVIDANRARPAEERLVWTVPGWPLAAQMLGPEQDPARLPRVEQAVRDGLLAPHALSSTTHTESLDPETLVRSLGFSSAVCRRFGRPLPVAAKMTDVPSHSWVLPTLLHHAGVKFLHLGCNGASQFPRVPPLFWWQGADGSRVLCAYTTEYGSDLTPPADWPARNYLAMIMTGDNQGPPAPAEIGKWRDRLQQTMPAARVRFGTLDDFARAVLTEKPDLPVVRGDMPDTWIHGLLANPIATKLHRITQPLAPALESLDSHLRVWGSRDMVLLLPVNLPERLAKVYEQNLLYGEHTWGMNAEYGPRTLYGEAWKNWLAEMEKEPLPADGDFTKLPRGSKRKWLRSYADHGNYAATAAEIVLLELHARLRLLASRAKGPPGSILVHNALPWPRSGIFTVQGKSYFAKDVPPCGYLTIQPSPDKDEQPHHPDSPDHLETPHFRAVFDLRRGGISSLVDKASGRDLADPSSPYVLGQFLHERFSTEEVNPRFFRKYSRIQDGWGLNDIGKPGMPDAKQLPYLATTPGPWTIKVRHHGTADTATLTAADPKGLAKAYSLTFTFPRHAAHVEVEWSVTDKTADKHPEGAWLCFPFAVRSPRFTVGRPGAPIDPAKDIVPGTNRHLQAVSTGVAIQGTDGGAALCPLDSPLVSLEKPGLWHWTMDFVPRQPSVFVNLYNNMWNTNFPLWQDGSWTERVRFWPISATDRTTADLAIQSWEARLPLCGAGPVPEDVQHGELPPTQAGLSVSRPGTLVTAFGPDAGGSGTLLRLWETAGNDGELTVTLPPSFRFTTATPVDLRGEPISDPVPLHDSCLRLPLKPYAPASFLLR